MIARTEAPRNDIWAELAARLPADAVQWRQQGKGKPRDGKFFAPFVAYIDAQFVRDRLDAVISGEWDLTLELLPAMASPGEGEYIEEPVAFKARLQILGVIREDVGTGKDYKTASTDAFKRAAVRFGIGHELYTDYEILWVQVDGDGKYAKAVEDPAQVYARKQGRASEGEQRARPTSAPVSNRAGSAAAPEPTTTPASATGATSTTTPDTPVCPKCSGSLWDNRIGKRNPKAPDWKCKDRNCDGVIWPPRAPRTEPSESDYAPAHEMSDELPDLPF